MATTKKIIFTVTNDLTYDQRMQRICTSMFKAGYKVVLVGRKLPNSNTTEPFSFEYKKLKCFFNTGFAFYAEYNIRLFFFLLFIKANAFCAIDLDTIIPNYFASVIRNKIRCYDAHELFTEQKEIITRPIVFKIWLGIEKFFVPKFKNGYTVNEFIKTEFWNRYQVNYQIIRNLPQSANFKNSNEHLNFQLTSQFIIYQGAVNEGRSFETLIPAMQQINVPLVICGQGNFFEQTKALIKKYKLEHKIILLGYVTPAQLKLITPKALFGLTLFDKQGLNQYYSLCNRFFDYTMANIPQICIAYPEYVAINQLNPTALLIENTDTLTIAQAINTLLNDATLYNSLQKNCYKANAILNWENEAVNLIAYWKNLLA